MKGQCGRHLKAIRRGILNRRNAQGHEPADAAREDLGDLVEALVGGQVGGIGRVGRDGHRVSWVRRQMPATTFASRPVGCLAGKGAARRGPTSNTYRVGTENGCPASTSLVLS